MPSQSSSDAGAKIQSEKTAWEKPTDFEAHADGIRVNAIDFMLVGWSFLYAQRSDTSFQEFPERLVTTVTSALHSVQHQQPSGAGCFAGINTLSLCSLSLHQNRQEYRSRAAVFFQVVCFKRSRKR